MASERRVWVGVAHLLGGSGLGFLCHGLCAMRAVLLHAMSNSHVVGAGAVAVVAAVSASTSADAEQQNSCVVKSAYQHP